MKVQKGGLEEQRQWEGWKGRKSKVNRKRKRGEVGRKERRQKKREKRKGGREIKYDDDEKLRKREVGAKRAKKRRANTNGRRLVFFLATYEDECRTGHFVDPHATNDR
jgi:hypothetical protein